MSDYGSDQGDVLVLSDENGNVFAIPREVVEQYRLTDQERAQLESQSGKDVSGYSMYQQFMNQQMASQHQAALRQAADDARMTRIAASEEEESASRQGTTRSSRLGGIMTGIWRSLPFGKPASSNA